MENSKQNIMEEYIHRYPQLCLLVKEGMSSTEEYKDIVLRGKIPAQFPNYFIGDEEDSVWEVSTPAGTAEILYLAQRQDFERAARCLAYKCEDRAVPPSMDAVTIAGIINWQKIRQHKEKYLASGRIDWQAEFKRFTAKPENYKDRLILLSKGGYSALTAEEAGYTDQEWEAVSLKIRMYHELCHVVCRSLFPKQKHGVVDEIVADCFGILKAAGFYDVVLAEKCLGIWGSKYRKGGRLENYLDIQDTPEQYVEYAIKAIRMLRDFLEEIEEKEYWDKILAVEAGLFGTLAGILKGDIPD